MYIIYSVAIIVNNIYLLFKPRIFLMNFKNQYGHTYSKFREKVWNVDPLNPNKINIIRQCDVLGTPIRSYLKKTYFTKPFKNSYQTNITSPLMRLIYFVKSLTIWMLVLNGKISNQAAPKLYWKCAQKKYASLVTCETSIQLLLKE